MITGVGPYIPAAAGFVAIVVTLVTFVSFIGLGALLGRRDATVESLLLSGCALAVTAATVIGTLVAVAVGWVLFPLLGLGIVVFAVTLYRPRAPQLPDTGHLLLAALPLLLIVSAASASQWDEFAHWLPNQRYLVDVGTFPRRGLPESPSGFAAYPYGLALVGFGISRLAGGFVENAGALVNTLLIPVLGISAVRAFRTATGEHDRPLSWVSAAAAIAVATLLNPTFVPKLVFTTYADWTTTVTLGVAAFMAWRIVEALVAHEPRRAIADALPLGFVFAFAISLKQPNIILVVLLLIGGGATAALGAKVKAVDWARLGLRLTLPVIVVYFAWRYHVSQHIPGREFTFLTWEAWLWEDLGAIFRRMLLIASKKGGYFGLMLLSIGTALYAVLRALDGRITPPVGRLAFLVAIVFLGYNAFLYIAYVGAFGSDEGRAAASYWRYNTQLGGMALVFGAAIAGMGSKRWSSTLPRRGWFGPAFVALVLLAPVILAPKIRFDLNPVTRYVRGVGVDMVSLIPPGARLVVIDPDDNGKRTMLLRYELAGRVRVDRWPITSMGDPSALRQTLASVSDAYLWVHVPTPTLSEVLAVDLESLSSYILEPAGMGGRVLRSWPYPGYTNPVSEDD